MVPTTRGWLWPSAVTAMPPVKSRYSLPSESQTRTPSPRTSATGYRLAKVMRCLSDHSMSCLVSTACPFCALTTAAHSRVSKLGGFVAARAVSSEDDLRADALASEHLEEDGVRHAPVDDVRLLRPALERAQRGLHLREH